MQINIDVTCNTPDEVLFANIEHNSRLPIEWVSEVEAHDGHAVIVGGGPSLIDSLDVIRWRHSLGQKIFALNGAAKFLASHGIAVDYLVILDARKANNTFASVNGIGELLIASQCHPDLFAVDKGTIIRLWHPAIENIESHLPDERESLTLIGGGTTVGLSAMCLAYTMGYRKMHLFGYDSSHAKLAGHAYDQPMNATEPTCKVTVFGKTFTASLAMAKQAEFFPTVCDNLIDLGCIITVDGDGLLPFIVRKMAEPPMSEQQKYELMWSLPAYRKVAPGEHAAAIFIEAMRPREDDTVIDFGCGTGRGAKAIALDAGCKVIGLDFASNCLDSDLSGLIELRHADLSGEFDVSGDIGYCTDVMEHIPPDSVDKVIQNIMRSVPKCFFQISTVDDAMGALIGHPLHLSVHPFDWWRGKFLSHGYQVTSSEFTDDCATFCIKRYERI